jgi:hypothetical protein
MPTATKPKRATSQPRFPEMKWGPFHGGVGVAVWLNEVKTENGPRWFRSLTIAPRRYRDPESGEWMDAASLRSTDLPALILALTAAHQYMASTPLPGQPVEEEPAEDTVPAGNGNGQGTVPF